MVTTGQVHVAGEVTTSSYVEIPSIVRETILGIGYDSSTRGFDGEFCGVSVSDWRAVTRTLTPVCTSPSRLASGIAADDYDRQGAGDQGIMFGYASTETTDLMPAPIWLAHRLAERLTDVRKQGVVAGLRPDGKTQVTLRLRRRQRARSGLQTVGRFEPARPPSYDLGGPARRHSSST